MARELFSGSRKESRIRKRFMLGFVAKNRAEVDAFYKAAIGAGGKSKEAPQARPEYYPGYYATWVLDPDGHDIEVVHKS